MFLHHLALRMGRTVSELRASLTVDELKQWYAFSEVHPIREDKIDYLFANLMECICSVIGAKKKYGGQFKLDDFLLFKHEVPKDAKSMMLGMFGGRVVKKGKRNVAR